MARLAGQYDDADAEVARCTEHAALLVYERAKTLAYYQTMAGAYAAAATEQGDAAEGLRARALATLGPSGLGTLRKDLGEAQRGLAAAQHLCRLAAWHQRQYDMAAKAFREQLPTLPAGMSLPAAPRTAA